MEISATSQHARRPLHAIARSRSWLYPLVSCALLGLATTAGHAQDAPKPADTPAAKTDTKPAKPEPTKVAAAPGQATPAQATPAPGAAAQPAPAPAPAGPAPGTVTVTGLIDIYYAVNARAPRGAGGGPAALTVTPSGEKIGIDNVGRAFDINDRELSFSLGEINITRTPGKGFPLGITTTLTVGDTARLVHATEPGGTSSWQTIQQAYLTYTPHLVGRDIPIDAGIFVTPFGQEVIESSSNDEYSRGFVFTLAIPLYHAGIRATIPLVNNKLSLLAALVNGWNNIADDNNAKSVIVGLTWTPSPKFTGVLNYMGGAEGTGAYGSAIPTNSGITTNLGEVLLTYNPTAKLKLAAEADYANGAGNIAGGGHVSGDWLGLAGYARYQITPRWAVALRVEQFEDMPGVGGVGLRLGGPYTRLRSGTVDLEYTAFRGHLVSRLEYRHDHSNTSFFVAGAGGAAADQDTFTLGEVYKF